MQWNFKVYEEPGIQFAERVVESDEPPFEQIQELMKPGIDQGRNALAVVTKIEDGAFPLLCPESPVVDHTFEELAESVTKLLEEGQPFAAATLVEGALKGKNAEDPEVQLIAASIFEHIRFYDFVAPLLTKVQNAFDDELRKAAISIRLGRALRKSGQQEDVSEYLEEPMKHPEMPPILKAEAMLLLAISKGPEAGLEILDEMLDYAEETLGEHRIVADALELHADYLAPTDPKKAEQFFLAAGKMLVGLQDPYFFSLNERFVVHFLRQESYKEALDLSHEMFEMLKQAGGPPIASVPYFVFASKAHRALGDDERSEFATKTAHEIDDLEAGRIEQLLEVALT